MLKIKEVHDIKKTATNKEYKPVTFENGKRTNVFSNDKDYDKIAAGVELDRTLVQNGEYWNLNRPASKGKGAFSEKKRQERKEDIKEAQDRKQDSIAFFNSTNCAIALLHKVFEAEEGAAKDPEKVKAAVQYWRNFFLKEYTDYKANGKANGEQPFEYAYYKV